MLVLLAAKQRKDYEWNRKNNSTREHNIIYNKFKQMFEWTVMFLYIYRFVSKLVLKQTLFNHLHNIHNVTILFGWMVVWLTDGLTEWLHMVLLFCLLTLNIYILGTIHLDIVVSSFLVRVPQYAKKRLKLFNNLVKMDFKQQ